MSNTFSDTKSINQRKPKSQAELLKKAERWFLKAQKREEKNRTYRCSLAPDDDFPETRLIEVDSKSDEKLAKGKTPTNPITSEDIIAISKERILLGKNFISEKTFALHPTQGLFQVSSQMTWEGYRETCVFHTPKDAPEESAVVGRSDTAEEMETEHWRALANVFPHGNDWMAYDP